MSRVSSSSNSHDGEQERQSGDCVSSRLPGGIEILDEQDFVALFVVEEVVNEVLGHQDTETARSHPLSVAIGHMPDRVIRRIGDGSVTN